MISSTSPRERSQTTTPPLQKSSIHNVSKANNDNNVAANIEIEIDALDTNNHISVHNPFDHVRLPPATIDQQMIDRKRKTMVVVNNTNEAS